MSKLRIVESSDAAEDIDPDMVKLAHDLLSNVASGDVTGLVVGFVNTDGEMDWGYSGQFCAYAMKTHIERRMGDLLDELKATARTAESQLHRPSLRSGGSAWIFKRSSTPRFGRRVRRVPCGACG